MAIEKEIKIVVDADEANKELKKVNENLEEGSENTEHLTGALDSMTGGAVSGFTKMLGGIKTAIKGFKSLRVAIISTGIGALLIAIVALTAAFKGSEEGQNKLAKIMGVIGVLTGNLVDLLADLGEKLIWVFENPKKALSSFADSLKKNIINRFQGMLELIPKLGKSIELLFKGQFKEAGKVAVNAVAKITLGVQDFTDKIKEAANATAGFIEEQKKEAKLAAEVADMRAKAAKIDRSLLIERARLEGDIADLRLKARQEDKFSAKERIDFLNEAQALQDKLLSQEEESLRLKRDAQKLENTFSRTNIENLDKEAQAEADILNIKTRRLNEQRTLQRELNSLSNQTDAQAEAEIKATELALEKEEERLLAIKEIRDKYRLQNEEDELNRLLLEQEKAIAELEALDASEGDKYELKKYYADKAIQLEKDKAKEAEKIDKLKNEGKLKIASTTASLLMMIADEQSAAYKAAAVVEATISTIQGAIQAYNSAQVYPAPVGPILGAVSAAAVAVSGALNIQKILSTNKSSAGAGSARGISTGGGAGSAASAPTRAPEFNVVEGTGTNQIAESLSADREPIKAYVVGSEVTTQQELDRNVVEEASI